MPFRGLMKAVVTGMIATYPVAGVLWDYVQYAIGLERLGFEVYYLEDSGLASYAENAPAYLATSLAWFSPGLRNRWHYRDADGASFGLSREDFGEIIGQADIFVNVSGGCLMREEYLAAKNRILIDTDPGLNHFVNFPKWDASPGWQGTHGYRAHDFFFTYAGNLGKPGCPLPDFGIPWHTTQPPVVMDLWDAPAPSNRWTTVMSWKPFQHYKKEIVHNGSAYGAKEIEFQKFASVPTRVPVALEVAVGGTNAPVAEWRNAGWNVVDAAPISADPAPYRDYIQNSRAEFSVAKNIYVATHCGWFSCRSVCYLAAGLPVVVQDTGFSELIPTGAGLFAFSSVEDAVRGIEAVESDYRTHRRAARDLACTHFASGVVLGGMLNKIGL
jgi:hypothetical protein